jgi:hypothetical protein
MNKKNYFGKDFDYSKFDYNNPKGGIIICPDHGEFIQTEKRHLNSKFGCLKCGHLYQGELKRKFDHEKKKLIKEKQKQTNLEKYGNENYNNRKKAVKTCIKKYGVDNVSKDPTIKIKIQNSIEDHFGEKKLSSPEILNKKRSTCLKKYGVDHQSKAEKIKKQKENTNLKKYGVKNPAQNDIIKKKIKQTNLLKYGVENPLSNKIIQEKRKQTLLKKYGVDNPWKSEEIKEKIQKSIKNIPDYYKNIAIKISNKRSKLDPIEGIYCDSTWEQNFVKTHPGCKRGPCIKYEDEKITHNWNIDFEWSGKLYEVKSPWQFFDSSWPTHALAKFSISKNLNIRWYLWNPGHWNWPKLDSIEEFKATKCHVGKLKNPWEGFNDPELKFRAEENLAKYITWPGMLERFLKFKQDKMLYDRFTIAKIAPRVTAGSKNEAKKHIIQACKMWGIPKKIINPCAGFGGWARACEDLKIPFEGFDVNPDLINFFDWKYQDLLTMNTITTDSWIWTSPPVFDKETWGQPIELQSQEWWYNLIQQRIKAPHYIFVNGTNDPSGGLFGNKNRKVLFI